MVKGACNSLNQRGLVTCRGLLSKVVAEMGLAVSSPVPQFAILQMPNHCQEFISLSFNSLYKL